MRRQLLLVLLLVILGVVGLGYLSWPVGHPFEWVCRWVEFRSGWRVSAAQVRWIPWRDLEFTDVKLQTPDGGRMHVVEVRVYPEMASVLRGHMTTRWQIGEVRMDPSSWGIRKPVAQEILSSGPVIAGGMAFVQMDPNRLVLETLNLWGSLLHLRAEGWLNGSRKAHLVMEGELARRLLESLHLMKPAEESATPWEPFRMRLDGALARPSVSFASNFFSMSFDTQGEQS